MLAVCWAFHHFVTSPVNMYILWFLIFPPKSENKIAQPYVPGTSLSSLSWKETAQTDHSTSLCYEWEWQWTRVRPGDFDLVKGGMLSIQRVSKHPVTTSSLSALGVTNDMYAFSDGKKVTLSSRPVKTAEVAEATMISRRSFQALHHSTILIVFLKIPLGIFLKEESKLRKFLFLRQQFHIVTSHLKAEACALWLI